MLTAAGMAWGISMRDTLSSLPYIDYSILLPPCKLPPHSVVLLLLLMSGDIEMDPRPVGECIFSINIGLGVLETEICSHVLPMLI